MTEMLQAEQFLKRYVERQLIDSRFLPEDTTAKRLRLVIPLSGVMSVVRIIEIDGVPNKVVRLIDASKRDTVSHLQEVNKLVEKHRLRAPLVLDVHESQKHGLIALLEEYYEGENPDPKQADRTHIESLARLFSRLHAVQSDRYGAPLSLKRGSFDKDAMGQVKNRMRGVSRRAGSAISGAEQRDAMKWFRAMSKTLTSVNIFSLIHDKPNRGNLLWQPEQKDYAMIDLATMQYGHRAKDLVQVFHEVLDGDVQLIENFLSCYFIDQRHGMMDDFLQVQPFYEGYYQLSACAINCRRAMKQKKTQGKTFFKAKIRRSWDSLQQVMAENPA